MSTETNVLEFQASDPSIDSHPVQGYLQTVRDILLEPSQFFRSFAQQYTASQALGFGVISIWLSSFFIFFFDAAHKIVIGNFLKSFLQDDSFDASAFEVFSTKQFLFEAAYLLLHPFFSLAFFLSSASIFLVLARLLVSRRIDAAYSETESQANRPIKFSQILSILGFAAVGTWFGVIPLLGGLLAYIAITSFMVIGFRESFQISSWRATFIVFAPQVLAAFFLFMLFLLILVLAASSDLLQMQDDADLEARVRFGVRFGLDTVSWC